MPYSLENVREHAFQFDSMLDTIIFHDNVRHIGFSAFDACSNLSYIRLPEPLEEITMWMLYGTNLESLVVPPHVISVGEGALGGCLNLHKVTLGPSVANLGDSLFNDGTALDTLVLQCTTPPSLGVGVSLSHNVVLVVPCSTAVAYIQHPEWGLFNNIVEDCSVGIEEHDVSPIRIHAENGRIVVDGAEDETVQVFDLTGRYVRNEVLAAGVYLVKVGTRPAQKVAVM